MGNQRFQICLNEMGARFSCESSGVFDTLPCYLFLIIIEGVIFQYEGDNRDKHIVKGANHPFDLAENNRFFFARKKFPSNCKHF